MADRTPGLPTLMASSPLGRQALTRARWTTTLTLVAVLVDTLGWAVTAVLVALAAGFFAYVCQSDLPG